MSETFTTMHHVLMDIADYFRECKSNSAIGSAAEKRFDVYVSAITDADRMLKEQEPRVLTLEEAEIFEDGWYWIEYQTIYQTSGIYHLRCHAIYPEGYDFDQPHSYIQMTEGDYGRYWRCWSARPTDEQREAVPWDT